ncbi:MAG: hypothetical protein C5B51_31960 [Terriglobia bacterium]|nr:MAG: hypothetical protein C5B51_31960 [Terriglobia bacterium]
MSSPPIPPQLEHLGTRPFSFYPSILNVDHNEWLFRKATWSEVLVVNCKSSVEIWIPRRFLGEISRADDPVLIVGLNKELEYKGGSVWPVQRRVIEMPVAVGGSSTVGVEVERTEPAPVVGIRVPPNTENRIFRLIAGALLFAILLYLGAVNLTRVGEVKQRVAFTARDQAYLDLSSRDDYTAVVSKLGEPGADRWLSESGEIQYRALTYPRRKYTVILMGSNRSQATYIGTMDDNWRPLHSVELYSGGTTSSLLRGLKRF